MSSTVVQEKKKSGSRKTSAINITGYLSKNAIFRAPVHPVSTENHWVVFLFNACSSLGTTSFKKNRSVRVRIEKGQEIIDGR